MRFFYDDRLQQPGVVITPSSESPLLPARNVLTESVKRVWRCGTTLFNESITVDLLSAKSATALVVSGFLYNSGATQVNFYLRGSTDNFASSNVLIGATGYDGTQTSLFAFSSQSFRYWRVEFFKDNASDVVDVGRIFLGTYFQTADQPDYGGYSEELVDPSPTQYSVGHQSYTDRREQYHALSANFTRLAEADASSIKTVVKKVGRHTPFFVQVQDSFPLDKVFYVKFVKGYKRDVSAFDSQFYYDLDLEFEEQV